MTRGTENILIVVAVVGTLVVGGAWTVLKFLAVLKWLFS